jgi:hypothetical protein
VLYYSSLFVIQVFLGGEGQSAQGLCWFIPVVAGRIPPNHTFDKQLISQIYKELKELNSKTKRELIISTLKRAKDQNRHLKENNTSAQQVCEKWSIFLSGKIKSKPLRNIT